MELDRNKLRRARERLGYSLEVVGEKAGLSKNSVLRAEHEEDIRPGTARKIAEALGVEVAELIADPKARSSSPVAPETQVGEERGQYLYPWMGETLTRLIDGWEQSIEAEQVDGRYAHAVAIAAMDTLGAVNLVGAPGETLRDRGIPENEIDERNRVSGRLHHLCNRAIDRYRDSEVFESDEERRLKERWGKLSLAS